jgi:hypothetical protein
MLWTVQIILAAQQEGLEQALTKYELDAAEGARILLVHITWLQEK